MTQNFHLRQSTEQPIDGTPLAGFVVKAIPDAVSITTWAGDIELRAYLNQAQVAKLVLVLLSGCETFVGAERIKRYSLATNAS